jgi:hypothetical protein
MFRHRSQLWSVTHHLLLRDHELTVFALRYTTFIAPVGVYTASNHIGGVSLALITMRAESVAGTELSGLAALWVGPIRGTGKEIEVLIAAEIEARNVR